MPRCGFSRLCPQHDYGQSQMDGLFKLTQDMRRRLRPCGADQEQAASSCYRCENGVDPDASGSHVPRRDPAIDTGVLQKGDCAKSEFGVIRPESAISGWMIFAPAGLILLGWFSVGGQPDGPSGASGGVVPDEVGPGTAWSGCCGQGADAGEDLIE
jgi:hypothetical protein